MGVIIRARMKPAVMKLVPLAWPPKMAERPGHVPTVSAMFWYRPWTAGAKTRIPHRPYTTDGTAARRSITETTGRRRRRGTDSTVNSAMPMLTGTARISAISDDSSVP